MRTRRRRKHRAALRAHHLSASLKLPSRKSPVSTNRKRASGIDKKSNFL
jgi:hypothetical protein